MLSRGFPFYLLYPTVGYNLRHNPSPPYKENNTRLDLGPVGHLCPPEVTPKLPVVGSTPERASSMHESSCPEGRLIHAIIVRDDHGADTVTCCSQCLRTDTTRTSVRELFETYKSRHATRLDWHPEFRALAKTNAEAKAIIEATKKMIVNPNANSTDKSSRARSKTPRLQHASA